MNVTELEHWISTYIQAEELKKGMHERHPLFWAIDQTMNLARKSPELCWHFILEVLKREPSEKVLAALAAGPLEDLIEYHGEDYIEKIEQESVRNPAFRNLLGGVWKSGTPGIWERIKKIRGPAW